MKLARSGNHSTEARVNTSRTHTQHPLKHAATAIPHDHQSPQHQVHGGKFASSRAVVLVNAALPPAVLFHLSRHKVAFSFFLSGLARCSVLSRLICSRFPASRHDALVLSRLVLVFRLESARRSPCLLALFSLSGSLLRGPLTAPVRGGAQCGGPHLYIHFDTIPGRETHTMVSHHHLKLGLHIGCAGP